LICIDLILTTTVSAMINNHCCLNALLSRRTELLLAFCPVALRSLLLCVRPALRGPPPPRCLAFLPALSCVRLYALCCRAAGLPPHHLAFVAFMFQCCRYSSYLNESLLRNLSFYRVSAYIF